MENVRSTNRGARHLTVGRRYYLGPYLIELKFEGPLQIKSDGLQLTYLGYDFACFRSHMTLPIGELAEGLKQARADLRAAEERECRCTHLTLQAPTTCDCGREAGIQEAQAAVEQAMSKITREDDD